MPKNQEWISLSDTGGRENDPEGGYFYVYRITGFGMSCTTGELTYDRRGGPVFDESANHDLVASMAKEMSHGPTVRHIFNLDTITDDVVDLLSDRGVKIIIERDPVS